jgi:hypothetical protein
MIEVSGSLPYRYGDARQGRIAKLEGTHMNRKDRLAEHQRKKIVYLDSVAFLLHLRMGSRDRTVHDFPFLLA